MFVTGDWLVPRLHGEPHWAKPPLVNWLGAIAMKGLGVTAEAVRLPSALAACVMVLSLATFAWQLRGPRAATLTAWLTTSTLHIAVLGRAVTTDMLHAAFTVAALVTLYSLQTNKRSGWRLAVLAGAFLGIAFLAKGPVGLGVTLVTLVGFGIISRTWRVIHPLHLLTMLAVALAIGLPWYLAAIAKHPALLDHWLGHEVRDRYLSSALKRTKPWWFLSSTLVGGLLPWTPVAVLGALRAWQQRRFVENRWLLAWAVFGFGLFQFSKSQLWTYLLPITPAFCVLAALELDRWADADLTTSRRVALRCMILASAVLLVGAEAYLVLQLNADPLTVVVGAAVVVMMTLAWGWTRRHAKPPPTCQVLGSVMVAAAALLVSMQFCLVRFARVENALGRQAGNSWIGEAVKRLEAHGVPIGTHVAPTTLPPLPKGVPRIVMWQHETNSLPFYAFGERREVLPIFDVNSWYELEADLAVDRPRTTEDLKAALLQEEPLYIIVLAHEVAALADHLQCDLEVIERRGDRKSPMIVRPVRK